MIKIIENRKDRVLFEKENPIESWFNNDCSDENLKKQCNRENDTITRVQFQDGKYIGSELMVYFKSNADAAASGKFQIKVSEIKQLKNRLRQINDNEISNVEFLDENGLPIKIDEKIMADWKFTGLNITDFIDSDFYITGFDNLPPTMTFEPEQ